MLSSNFAPGWTHPGQQPPHFGQASYYFLAGCPLANKFIGDVQTIMTLQWYVAKHHFFLRGWASRSMDFKETDSYKGRRLDHDHGSLNERETFTTTHRCVVTSNYVTVRSRLHMTAFRTAGG